MNNLRDRIAEVLYEELPYSIAACVEAADAVIAELGLHLETGQRSNPTGPLWGSNNRHTVHRYVTYWKADDE
jgi:hypothetical protein